MQDLIAVGFPGIHRAAEVLDRAQALDAEATIDLADAVAVYRADDGRLRVDRSVQPTSREGAALGGLMGALLGGVLAAPFTAGVSAAAAAAALGAGALGFGTVGAAVGSTDASEWKADAIGAANDLHPRPAVQANSMNFSSDDGAARSGRRSHHR